MAMSEIHFVLSEEYAPVIIRPKLEFSPTRKLLLVFKSKTETDIVIRFNEDGKVDWINPAYMGNYREAI